jgi:hypothetical protein
VIVLIIRFSLLLIMSAIAFFLLAIVLEQLTINNIAGHVSQLGAIVLLCAFSLLLSAGLGVVASLITTSFRDYFSTRQRMERKLLFYNDEYNRLHRLFQFKKARLLYFNQQHRKKLNKKEDWKSVSS